MVSANSCKNFTEHLLNHPCFTGKSLSLILSSEYKNNNLATLLCKELPELKLDVWSLEKTDPDILSSSLERQEVGIIFCNHLSSMDSRKKNETLAPKLEYLCNRFNDKILGFTDINNGFDDVFAISPVRLSELNSKILELGRACDVITIQNSHGTNLTISAKSCDRWVSVLGFGDSDDHTPSEVATFTHDINGTFVFRGMFLCEIPFALKHGFIDEPVIFTIKNGKIISMKTENSSLDSDLRYYMNQNNDHKIIREVGFGTNEGLKTLPAVSASFIERHPGLHLGLGGIDPDSFHLDLISCDSDIYFDNRLIFKDRYRI